MDIDYGKNDKNSSSSEYGVLVFVLLLVSVLIHAVCLYCVRDMVFFSVPIPESGKRSSLDVPKMNVSRMQGDPLKAHEEFRGRPVKAPDSEKQEERVDRLAGDAGAGTSPDDPARVDVNFEMAESESKKLEVVPENLVPKLDVEGLSVNLMAEKAVSAKPAVAVDIDSPVTYTDSKGVFDIGATVIPPAHAVGSLGLPVTDFGKSDGPAFVSMPPPPSPDTSSLDNADAGGASGSGSGAGFSALVAVSGDLVKGVGKKGGQGATAVKPVELPADDVPPPSTPRVDIETVEKEKESVRRLRDESAEEAESFEPFVNIDLASWIDPAAPDSRYFRLRVASRDDRVLPVIPKDVVYLIDVSGSVGRERVRSCAKALRKSIKQLGPQDRFNIVKFAKHFSYAFPERSWQKVSSDSLEKAEEWLSDLKAGGNTDVFGTLESILSLPRNPSRPVIAYVITDGDATSGVIKPAQIISKFSKLNGGLISVYMHGVKNKSNRYLMDMIAHGNRGDWIINDTRFNSHSRAGDKLPEFTEKHNSPLLTDVAVMFASSSKAEAYPKLVSNLYSGQPIDIYGVCPADRKNIVFSMRGLNASKAYDHLFEIPFTEAEASGEELKKEWAQLKAHAMVEEYTLKPSQALKNRMIIFAARNGIEIPYQKEISK